MVTWAVSAIINDGPQYNLIIIYSHRVIPMAREPIPDGFSL